MRKNNFDGTINYILGSETAVLIQLKDSLIDLNNALEELSYYNNEINYYICSHHKYGRSYVPIIEVKKDHVFIKITAEKAELLNKLDEQLIKVKNLNAIAKLNLPIIDEVEKLLGVTNNVKN